ncbi:SMP-30/gluconolactonase/LRE family protein [Pseudomonas fulva]|uniref:hypothetical protein n=1 Tax=Pseudomonas TaxID=286 RepID=UPI002447E34C|nr:MULTISPECIES: hypothetical protein [Pseudomonas]MDH0618971.1 SMP-30/gluconolactonase/LRE family protein [Pseudomonas fulva]MDH1306944.1 SMP-30/gluconolactonase/LRE family protein [Pseudomonas fulva]
MARTLHRAPYPADGNHLQQVSVFARLPEQLGRPDGLALDIEQRGGFVSYFFQQACKTPTVLIACRAACISDRSRRVKSGL